MIEVKLSTRYVKKAKIIIKRNKGFSKILVKKIKQFRKNPKSNALKNHKLKGTMRDHYSFRIRKNLRIIYRWREDGAVIFIDIGTHDEVYQ